MCRASGCSGSNKNLGAQNLSRSLIGRILDGSDPAAAEFRSWPGQDANKLTQYVPTTLLGPIIAWLGATTLVRCFLKSKVFSEEKEWRIIAHRCDAADQEFRPSNGILLPYVPRGSFRKRPLFGLSLRVAAGQAPVLFIPQRRHRIHSKRTQSRPQRG